MHQASSTTARSKHTNKKNQAYINCQVLGVIVKTLSLGTYVGQIQKHFTVRVLGHFTHFEML